MHDRNDARLDPVVDGFAKHPTVWQLSEIVVGRQEPGALLGFLTFRHILKEDHRPAARQRLMGECNNPAIGQQASGMG